MGPEIPFTPTYIRGKKAPLKRDVKLWLAFNGNAVLNVARSIRDDHPESFPVLADALEERRLRERRPTRLVPHWRPRRRRRVGAAVVLGKE